MNTKHAILLVGPLAGILSAAVPAIRAQEITGTPGSPTSTSTTGGKQLPLPEAPFGGVIKTKATDSTPY